MRTAEERVEIVCRAYVMESHTTGKKPTLNPMQYAFDVGVTLDVYRKIYQRAHRHVARQLRDCRGGFIRLTNNRRWIMANEPVAADTSKVVYEDAEA